MVKLPKWWWCFSFYPIISVIDYMFYSMTGITFFVGNPAIRISLTVSFSALSGFSLLLMNLNFGG